MESDELGTVPGAEPAGEPRGKEDRPRLRLASAVVFVRESERSIRFYWPTPSPGRPLTASQWSKVVGRTACRCWSPIPDQTKYRGTRFFVDPNQW